MSLLDHDVKVDDRFRRESRYRGTTDVLDSDVRNIGPAQGGLIFSPEFLETLRPPRALVHDRNHEAQRIRGRRPALASSGQELALQLARR
jgi:hypothetical protein